MEDLRAVIAALLNQAKAGDVASIKELLQRLLGPAMVTWESLSVTASRLELFRGGRFVMSLGRDKVLRLSSVVIDPSGGSTLDLADNALIIDYSAGSPLQTIAARILAGRTSGTGITSSAADTAHALGYAEAADLFTAFPTSFLGQTVDSTAVLVRHTLNGDANLDGTVDTTDFNLLAASFSLPGRWFTGDFNYDGIVDSTDFNLLASNFGQSILGEVSTTSKILVPEPSLVGLAAIGLVLLRRFRGVFRREIV